MAIQTRFVAKNGLDNNSKTITNVSTPVNSTDVANKAYVDTNSITPPVVAGTSGQVLTSAGTGVPTWTTPASGGGGSGITAGKSIAMAMVFGG